MCTESHNTTTILWPFTGQPALASTSSKLENFVGAKLYCPNALTDGNQCIRIREEMLEFSSTVLYRLSP